MFSQLWVLAALSIPPFDECAPFDSGKPPIPNVVHQSWIGGGSLRWEQVLAMMSVRHVLRPMQYVLYYDVMPPPSETWLCALTLVDRLEHRKPRTHTFMNGPALQNIAHKSDHMRIDLLDAFGGIHLDHDAYVIRPLDELRRCGADVIAGYHRNRRGVEKMNNGVLLARQNASFFELWRRMYREKFQPFEWDQTSCIRSLELARAHPTLALPLPRQLISPLPRLNARQFAGIVARAYVVHLTGLNSPARDKQLKPTGVMRTITERVLGAAGALDTGKRSWSSSPAIMAMNRTTPMSDEVLRSFTERTCLARVRAYMTEHWG